MIINVNADITLREKRAEKNYRFWTGFKLTTFALPVQSHMRVVVCGLALYVYWMLYMYSAQVYELRGKRCPAVAIRCDDGCECSHNTTGKITWTKFKALNRIWTRDLCVLVQCSTNWNIEATALISQVLCPLATNSSVTREGQNWIDGRVLWCQDLKE